MGSQQPRINDLLANIMLRSWRWVYSRPLNCQKPPIPHLSRRKLSDLGTKPSTTSSHPLPGSLTHRAGSQSDPYNYTSGRWLNRDELERKSRHIAFDFSALCDRAIRLYPGASKIVDLEKKEGGFNRVFILTMDSGARAVARLPTGIAGPPKLTTNSEVATMTYLRSKTGLPIPKILDWSDDPSNAIGAEYIIQEHVSGVQLHEAWPNMTSEQHMLCTKALSLALRKMAALDFPAYGSIYFSNADGPGPLDSYGTTPLEEGFCVGPNCSSIFWNRDPGELELYGGSSSNCGPWDSLAGYCQGLIETGFSRLPKSDAAGYELLPHQGSVQDHIRLLKISQEVLQRLIKDKRIQDAATPVLLHPDYHKRNIHVSDKDPTIITGLIDWQSTSIEPAFIYANEIPDFAAPPRGPDEYAFESIQDEHSEQTERDREREQKDASICHQTYDVCMKGLVAKLRPARLLDPTLFRLFHYSPTTWRNSATAITQELLELSARWEELGLQGSCPYTPTTEELEKHARDYEDFETVQRLKLWLRDFLHTNSDGWVPNEAWDASKEAHRAVYDEWIQTARDEGMTVAKAERLWPFDAR